MSGERYVVLGLAHPRAAWFHEVARWAHGSSLPMELIKCVSAEELRARLGSGRAFSAAIVDSRISALDRDLLDEMKRAGCPTLVVEDRRRRSDWPALGAAAVLSDAFDRQELLKALGDHSTAIATGDRVPSIVHEAAPRHPGGIVVAVCGPGGAGASTVAIAVCQGLAGSEPSAAKTPSSSEAADTSGPVMLADLARHAEQSMLHDAGDVVPGVQELVEAHRNGQLGRDGVMALTFLVEERGYHLLLGLRRSSWWPALRPRAFEAAFASLRQAFAIVVADVDADVEGERDGGSLDVEERNVMSRTAIGQADVVLVVGDSGMKGVHSLARVVCDLLGLGVPGSRIVPVLNRAPRSRRSRAELVAAFAALVGQGAASSLHVSRAPGLDGVANTDGRTVPSPIFLPERRVEDCLRDGVRLPSQMTLPLAGAVRAVQTRHGRRQHAIEGPQLIAPGSLGHWGSEDPVAGAPA